MDWIKSLVGSKPDAPDVTSAKAKKDAITKRCADEQTAVDKEIIDAKVQSVDLNAAVKSNGTASLSGGKSEKKRFSKKRKGGKRAKSQKKRR